MFSGIVQMVASVACTEEKNGSLLLTLGKPAHCVVKPGDSVAVAGTCLTVVKAEEGFCTFELMPETLQKTIFGSAVPKRVNVEQSLRVGDALGGHVVTGHIDAIGTIRKILSDGDSRRFEIEFPGDRKKLIAEKGSVAVDGVSLTVAGLRDTIFTVAIIPYTLENTTFGDRKEGDLVNIEFDIIAKHLARMTEF